MLESYSAIERRIRLKGVEKAIIQRTLRIPLPGVRNLGNGSAVVRQLDAVLMNVGFKLTRDALNAFSKLHPENVLDLAVVVLDAVKELVGGHVQHNVYFKEFPKNVPDTLEFWTDCIIDALSKSESAETVALQLMAGSVNLLDLPKYGRYQHSYEDMVAAHEKFMPSLKTGLTFLEVGVILSEEAIKLYNQLAGSSTPLSDGDKELLSILADICIERVQPTDIPIRENKAIINKVRIENNLPLLVDTPTDVLRLACALSDGDVTLTENTKFKSFSRAIRRRLMLALHNALEGSGGKRLSAMKQHTEQWKRLGERLHPHEYTKMDCAQLAFSVARGDKVWRSLATTIEKQFVARDIAGAISSLSRTPGTLFRSIDRILRIATNEECELLFDAIKSHIAKVSCRVILSLREHLMNRTRKGESRVFANSKGTAWVAEDTREPLDPKVVGVLLELLDTEIERRLPEAARVIMSPDICNVALPLSAKNESSGFHILPRGSTSDVEGGILRFFTYWKQKAERTDFDLSAIFLDRNFQLLDQLSYTSLQVDDGVHSGDLVEAEEGASEFIDIPLDKVQDECRYIIPSINKYSGENFLEVAESFFGFMTRSEDAHGMPFEAATVQSKFDLRGKGNVALPLAFIRTPSGWTAKWLNLYMNGWPRFNAIENNRVSTSLIARSIIERDYLGVSYLIELMARCEGCSRCDEITDKPVTYIGLNAPEKLPVGSLVYTLANLHELIPK